MGGLGGAVVAEDGGRREVGVDGGLLLGLGDAGGEEAEGVEGDGAEGRGGDGPGDGGVVDAVVAGGGGGGAGGHLLGEVGAVGNSGGMLLAVEVVLAVGE